MTIAFIIEHIQPDLLIPDLIVEEERTEKLHTLP